MTRFRGISETAPVEISIDRSLEIIAPPVPTLTIPDVPALNPGNGPITLPGATITYGSLPALSGIGIIILTPPLIISGPILLNPLPVGVVVDGTAQEGQTLSVTASSAIVSAQWQRLIGGSWVDVAGATHTVYTVQPDDIGRQMRVQIIGTDGLALTSGPSNAVRDAAGNQYVYETTAATSIESGMLQYVYGTAVGTTVAAGGQQNIYAGGFAAASTLDIGGIQIDWGYAHGTVVSGGTQFVWGTASHTTISGGQQFVEAGGLANETEIYPAGEQTVLTAGHASNTTVGGIQTVYGSADATTVSFGGLQRVHGQVGTTTVRHHSQQNIYADGTATDTTLHDGSVQIDWGMATNTIVGMNSTQYVWGIAVNTTLSSSNLGAAGNQHVGAGGLAQETQIGAHSTQYVHGGGTSSGTIVGVFGRQVIYGNDLGATIFGGTQDVWGVATDATVVSGTQNVHAGGLARNSTIDGFASVHVFAGGAIENVTFGSTFGGLILDEGSSLTGSISGWQSVGSIDLAGIHFDEGTTTLAYAANSDHSGGVLTVSDGSHTIALSLLGQYTAADFAIASDGHGGTSVYNQILLSDITITPLAA